MKFCIASAAHSPLKRRFFAASLLVSAASALASAQTYKIVPNLTTVPAGDYGINIHTLLVDDTSPTPDVRLCVFTGYGSAAPISASAYSAISGGMEAKFDALPSTVQEVPPSAFTNGTFPAVVYTVPLSTTTCTGASQASTGTAVTLTLAYPKISSLNLAAAPQQNPSLPRRLPNRVEVLGANFLQQTTSAYITPSQVIFNYASGSPIDASVDYVSLSALQSTLPATIPSDATSVTVTVCNTAIYSYCSAPYTLSLTPLQAEFGDLTASPPVAAPTQPVTFNATFGTAAPSVNGVPSGQVVFSENGTTISSAPLLLDATALFVHAPKATFTTSSSVSSLKPIVADFNKDGLPDVLFVETGAVTNGKQFPVLHVLLGTTPAGQFASDLPYTGFSSHPCATLVDLAVADFNADGYPDLAVLCANPTSSGTTSGNTIYVLLNMRNGVFLPTTTAFGPVYGSRIVAADFNHDGKQDLVIAGPLDAAGDTGLQVLLGDAKGDLSIGPISSGLDTSPSTSFGGFQIAAIDLNNDGSPEIAILNASSSGRTVDNFIQIFKNSGSGAFTLATTVPTDGTATASFIIAPIRTGQLPALIVTSTASSASGVSVALNTSTHTIAFSSTTKFTAVKGLAQAVAGDFNGDGTLDIAVTDANSTHVLTGDGSGIFTATYSALTTTPNPGETLIAATDENGDGYADLITAVPATGNITLHSYITAGTATASTPGLKSASGVHRILASTAGTVEIAPASTQTDLTITGTAPIVALYTSASSPLNYGNTLTLYAAITDPTATGSVSFYNGSTLLGTAQIAATGTFAVAHFTPKVLNAGTYNFTVDYAGDSAHSSLTSAPFQFVIAPLVPTLFWVPAPASIGYGTALSAAQLDAVAQSSALPAPGGTYTYSQPLGTVLKIGANPISVTFTSNSPNYTNASASTSITVFKATPVINWPTPADVIVDTLLSATQLDATVATPQGADLPGTFVYTPIAGTKLSVAGAKKLSLLFTPTDTTDYTTATATVSINVGPIGISSIAPAAALLGDAATTVAIVGTGFSPTAKVQLVGPALPAVMVPTTYVSSTRLSAIVPAADLLHVQTILLSVVDPTKDLPSNAVPFIVTAPSTTVGVNAPTSISPASQNTVTFHLAAYPAPVTANFTIAFKPSGTLPDDPGITFVDSGLRTASIIVLAHPAALDLPITFQSGTIAGTLTLTLLLDAGGANVTPATIQPIVIPEPIAVPGISSVTLVPDGNVLTVTTRGFSNTRNIAGASFHFTPVPGQGLTTSVINLDVTALFSTWYANPESEQYGSLFTYTEVFNLSSDASVVGQVTVTLTNDVGASQEANQEANTP